MPGEPYDCVEENSYDGDTAEKLIKLNKGDKGNNISAVDIRSYFSSQKWIHSFGREYYSRYNGKNYRLRFLFVKLLFDLQVIEIRIKNVEYSTKNY